MSVQTIHYITSNPMKRRMVERFARQKAAHLKIETREVSFYEPQTLDESEVISYKAREAWQLFQCPLIVDDAGFYLEAFPHFPGPLAKPTVMGLGWRGMLDLALPSHRANIYCRLGYVDQDGRLHHFRGEIAGALDTGTPGELVERRGIFALLKPDGSSKTIAQMAGTVDADIYTPRAQALNKFLDFILEQNDGN
jgi:XTP/dITP diphosphohydrolase